jgi:hydroxyethylthiazole kinase-like uncharacterized protein yjeF
LTANSVATIILSVSVTVFIKERALVRISGAKEMKGADERAIFERGIPSLTLMETAAGSIAKAVIDILGSLNKRRIVVFSGSGNNGGDGLAAARILKLEGADVGVWMTGSRDRVTRDTAVMLARALECSIPVRDFSTAEAKSDCKGADVIIDAMFGIGLNSHMRGAARDAVNIINSCSAAVVAADIASGVEADTGRVLGCAVNADVTVTFSCAKPGHLIEPGCCCTGKLIIADIGLPDDLVESSLLDVDVFTRREAGERLPVRRPVSHKGDYGKILVIAGSRGYSGAPSLAASAASRAGAGIVWVGVPACIYPIVAQKSSEVMPVPLPDDSAGSSWRGGALTMEALEPLRAKLESATVCLIGPGLGRSEETQRLIREIISGCSVPLVIDADGINALEGHIDLLKSARCPVILTPHEGEFARLGGDIEKHGRLYAAQSFAAENKCTLVLKGHRSITVSPGGRAFVNTTGNAGMAKGGSGDVLAGVIAALVGQGAEPFDAAAAGVWIHGAAGDAAAAKFGMYSMSPDDTISALSEILRTL